MATLARMQVDLVARTEAFQRNLDSAAKKMESMGRRMTDVGRRLSTRVTLPLAAIGAASVKMASDAEEAANKFDVVMGGSATEVRNRLRDLADTIPLTTAEMEGMAAGIQDLLVPMGLVREDAAGMSVDMVQLAGDIASFNNVLPTEALMAMRSALAGESEPMRRFGVDTRVARLEALALEEGLIRLGEELDETARAQAVMLAIQRDSADAMGDAARTADSTANLMKFLARDVKQLGIDIGTVLIPAVRPLLQALSEKLRLVKEIGPETLAWGLAIAGAAAALGPLLLIGGQVAVMVSSLVAAVGGLSAALGTLAAATTALNAALGPAGWLALGIGAVAAGVGAWELALDPLVDKLKGLRGELSRGLDMMNEWEAAQLRMVREAPRNIAEQVIPGITATAQRVPRTLSHAERLQLSFIPRRIVGERGRRTLLGRMDFAPDARMGAVGFRQTGPINFGLSGRQGPGAVSGFAENFFGGLESGIRNLIDPTQIASTALGNVVPKLFDFVGGLFDSGEAAARAFQQMRIAVERLELSIKEFAGTATDTDRVIAEAASLVQQLDESVTGIQLKTGLTFEEAVRQGLSFREAFDIGFFERAMLAMEVEDAFIFQVLEDYNEILEAASDKLGDLGSEAGDTADALSDIARILNAPQGLKVGLRRFQASDPDVFLGTGSASAGMFEGGGDVGRSSMPPIVVQIDGRTLLEIVEKQGRYEVSRGGSSGLSVRPSIRRG